MGTKKKWYQNTRWIIALLILFFPAGLYLMWKYATWKKPIKWIITAMFVLGMIGNISGSKNASTTMGPQNSTPTVNQATEAPVQPTVSTEQQVQEPTKVPVKTTNAPVSKETVSQKNAIRKAKSYLSYTAFSHDGLVSQLEYEKFSSEDALYGADNSGANWNEQAAKKAKSYMDMSAYSRDGLIEQLKYEKFTQEQAEYGAKAVGL